MINSGSVDNAAFGDLVAAAVAIFAAKSKALPGLLITFFANFLPAFAEIFPKFLKKLLNPSALIVLSETVINFFLLQIEQYPISTLLPLEVILP